MMAMGGKVWLAAAGIFVLALLVRLSFEQPHLHFDECYHVLAAEGLNETGVPVIGEGEPYRRGLGYTHAVAWSYQLFGESVRSARLPSVLAGALLAAVVFAFTFRHAGPAAGWTAGLMVALSTILIHYSLLSRFYMAQCLMIFVVAALVYELSRPTRWWQMALLLGGSLAAGAVALHLQISSVVPLGVIGGWLLLVWFGRLFTARTSWQGRAGVCAGLAVLMAAAGAVAYQAGFLDLLLAKGDRVDLWAASRQHDYAYYHNQFLWWHPLLWRVAPLLVVVGLVVRPKLTLFCGLIFAAGFIVHSFAAWKAPRYVMYVMPFFFVICSIAIVGIGAAAHRWIVPRLARSASPPARRRVGVAFTAVFVLLVVAALGVRGDFRETPRGLAGAAPRTIHPQANWRAAVPVLAPLIASCDAHLSSANVKSQHHFGRVDYALNASQLRQREQFVVDWRLDTPIITEPEALQRVMQDAASGVVVVEKGHWRDLRFVPVPLSEFIETHLEAIALPEASGVLAFRWPPSDRSPSAGPLPPTAAPAPSSSP